MTDQIFYESSNGDTWSLTVGPVGKLVKHIPNPRSGGKTSFINITDFLEESRMARSIKRSGT